MNERYSVVLTGEVLEGRNLDDVKASLAVLFKTDAKGIEQLFARAPVRIKADLEHSTAIKYQAAVEKAGALCELRADDAMAASAANGSDGARSSGPPPGGVDHPPASAGSAGTGAIVERDVYAPPEASLETLAEAGAMVLGEPARLSAGRGWAWIVEGLGSFRADPGLWIGVFVVWLVIMLALGIIPFGSIAAYILQPIFIGGLMLGCWSQDQGDGLEFRHLFAGFSHQTGKLAAVGGINLGAFFALTLTLIVFGLVIAFVLGGGFEMLRSAVTEGTDRLPPEAIVPVLLVFGIATLLGVTGGMLIVVALWFAPVLIVIHEIDVWEAIKLSWTGIFRNWVAFLVVYGSILFGLMILASLPLFLGWFVLGPVLIASIYHSYKDIYLAR